MDESGNLGFYRLARLWHYNYIKPNKIFDGNLKTLLNTKELWYASYIKIRSNKGSETPGVDFKTLDRTTQDGLDRLREKVIDGKFEWSDIKRVEIPKGNGKTRPLGIPTLNDRLVQEVLRMILEAIFEPTFSGNSHGFRPGRGCHTALKQVNTRFKASKWYIEGDIKSYFDTIDHGILVNLLRRKVRDNRILGLVETALKANIIFNGEMIEHVSGTPQGGILSPLLSNIYLHELDVFMENMMIKYQGTKRTPRTNPAYRKLMDKLRDRDPKEARKLPSADPLDSEYISVKYVRYADDFLVGINGPRKLAEKLRGDIRIFLREKLNLTLSVEKTHITPIAKKVPFLGYSIGRSTLIIKQKVGRGSKIVNRKKVIHTLDGDVKKMVKNLAKAGFCNQDGQPRPKFKYLPLPQSEINNKINSIILGISNWWALAGNRRRAVARISYILRHSAAKLYAAKFGLLSSAKVFEKGGIGLDKPLSTNIKSITGVTDEMVESWTKNKKEGKKVKNARKKGRVISAILYDKYKDIPRPMPNKLPNNWEPEFVEYYKEIGNIGRLVDLMRLNKIKSTDMNPLSRIGFRLNKGIRVLGEECVVCGTEETVEMHHVKNLKNLGPIKNELKDRMKAIMRKQIPLCRKHHLQIHEGNWRNKAISIQTLLKNIAKEESKAIDSVEVGEPRDG
jgi:group II intron reverse transcriptase/maturase